MKFFFKYGIIFIMVFVLAGCGRVAPKAWSYTDTAMGTVIHQGIYCEEEEIARNFSQKAMEELEHLEQEILSWRLETAEVYEINASAGSEEGYLLSKEMGALLWDCMALSEASEGAFDIGIGALVRLWDIDRWAAQAQTGVYQVPSEEEVRMALQLCSGQIRLEADRVYLPEGMGLDLGAVGKGIALTKFQSLLEKEEAISGAVISVGGSILTYGKKADGTNWIVGITDPFGTSDYIGTLSLDGQWCVSTSGNYERYVEVDGVRYHHILDPATGYPADSGVSSVTVLSENGMLSDGLSTACFILGPQKGMTLAEKYGVEVLYILDDGSIILSEGMKPYWTQREQ
ncbi:MAG: FAD:protein FMN transferase [Lachnospiraceae bacterium]|nr:FAD:protein FMN transferase [Lachnospiraceae bacterium]